MTTEGQPKRNPPFLSPPFIVAVVLLGVGAVLAGPLARWLPFAQALAFKRVKDPLPLVKPLPKLDVSAIEPYRVVQQLVHEPAVVEQLGTEDYISWRLEDTSVAADDPLRFVSLDVTYYTGGHNLVPHTPDVCRVGGGYQQSEPAETREVVIDTLPPEVQNVPLRLLTFVKTAIFDNNKTSVTYTFCCNGDFTASRDGVRLRVSDPTTNYAYFSKVEISFPDASREQNLAGAVKLLRRVLPVLRAEHWPDIAAAEAALKADETAD